MDINELSDKIRWGGIEAELRRQLVAERNEEAERLAAEAAERGEEPPPLELVFVFDEKALGIALNAAPGGQIAVKRVLPESAAAKQKVPTNVYLIRVNGAQTEGKHKEEVQGMIRDGERPIELVFVRPSTSDYDQHVLAPPRT